MLSKFEKHLTDMNVFNAETPKIVTALIDTIPNNVPYKMKQVLTIHEIVTYISQFRFNILHWNNSIIPINVITFLIAESGMGKDSIVKTIRKSFQPSYDLIRNKQLQILEQQAIQRAVDEGLENPTSYHIYNQFLKPLNVHRFCSPQKKRKNIKGVCVGGTTTTRRSKIKLSFLGARANLPFPCFLHSA